MAKLQTGGADEALRSESKTPSDPQAPSRRFRWVYRLAVIVAVSPIAVTAVRYGLAGWEPIEDTGRIAIRVRDVLTTHPPLYGLAAWTSVNAPEHYSFPGALEYYLLAVPVRLFGTNWGILLGMAAINIGACVSALWLVRRRLGDKAAIVAAAFCASLLWAMGGLALIDPSQHNMGVIPVFALLVAAWSVADGDDPALVVLAVVGNYLLLDLPDVAVVAPVLIIWALAMRWLRRRRVGGAEATPDASSHVKGRRWAVVAVAFTLVVWIPPVIDQVAGSHNLGKLAHAAVTGSVAEDQPASLKPTVEGSFGVISSITMTPRWWFRPTYQDPPFSADGGGEPLPWRGVWAVAVAGAVAYGIVRLRRRGERTPMLALSTFAVGCGAFFVTILRDPSDVGFAQVDYVKGLWPLAVFGWFALVWVYLFADEPLVRPARRLAPLRARVGVVAVAAFAAAAQPLTATGWDWQMFSVARQLRHATSVEFAGSGPVQVSLDNWMLHYYEPSMMLGLQDVGVGFRTDLSYNIQQFGEHRDVKRHPAVARVQASSSVWPPEGGRLIARAIPPARIDDATFQAYGAKMQTWAKSSPVVEPSRKLHVTDAKRAELRKSLASIVTKASATSGGLLASPDFLAVLSEWGSRSYGPIIEVPGLSEHQMTQWADEKLRREFQTVYLYRLPASRR